MALLVLERVQLRTLVGVVQSLVGILQVPVVLAVVPLPLETLAVETLSGKLPGKIRVRKNLSWKVRSTLERKTLSGKLLPKILARLQPSSMDTKWNIPLMNQITIHFPN